MSTSTPSSASATCAWTGTPSASPPSASPRSRPAAERLTAERSVRSGAARTPVTSAWPVQPVAPAMHTERPSVAIATAGYALAGSAAGEAAQRAAGARVLRAGLRVEPARGDEQADRGPHHERPEVVRRPAAVGHSRREAGAEGVDDVLEREELRDLHDPVGRSLE